MLMSPVATVPLGRTGQVRFAPGGHTALLYNLQRPLAVGDSARLTVQLQSGRTATTTARHERKVMKHSSITAP